MDSRVLGGKGSGSGVPLAVGRAAGSVLAVAAAIGLACLGFSGLFYGLAADLDRLDALLVQGDDAAARAAIRSLIRSYPADTEAYQHIIRSCVRCSLYTDAAWIGEMLLNRNKRGILRRRLQPQELAEIYFALSWSYKETGSLDRAEQMGRAALAIDPDSPELLNGLGYLYADEGYRLNEALRLTKRAVSLAPDDGAIVDSLGWTQYRLRRYDSAVRTLRRAVELAPESAELRYHLGSALARLGRKFEARIEITKALLLDGELAEARELLKTVNK